MGHLTQADLDAIALRLNTRPGQTKRFMAKPMKKQRSDNACHGCWSPTS